MVEGSGGEKLEKNYKSPFEGHKIDVFTHIKGSFSTEDIRNVYTFIKMIGGGHFGTVRIAELKSDPGVKYAIKSILRD